jgi:hypothetical protein
MDFPQQDVFIRHERFQAGSAKQAQAAAELHRDMQDHLRDGLTRIAELIEQEAEGQT